MKKTILAIFALIVAAFGGSQVANLGGSPGNLPSEVATSSTVEVGRGPSNLIATTTAAFGNNALCSARVITTGSDPIIIAFTGGAEGQHATTSLQLGQGHLQAASSTTNYDSDVFGCGSWLAASVGAGSTTVIISESRQ